MLMCEWLEASDGDLDLVKKVKVKLGASEETKPTCAVCGENILSQFLIKSKQNWG